MKKEDLRPVTKADFIKAIEVCSPTLNREQYNNYKKFGDEDNRGGDQNRNTVSYNMLPQFPTLNNQRVNST